MKNTIDKILEWTLIVSMSLLVIDVLWQVFSRFILQDPSSFTEELARFLLIWVGLLGAAYAAGKRMHLAVDLLPRSLEGKRKAYLDIFIYSIVIIFSISVMIFGGSRLVAITLYLGQTAAALQMPLGYVYLILPISGFLIAFYAALHLVDEFRVLSGQAALFSSPIDSSTHLDVD
ncbi:MAG: TRAP transporter small permease [Rhodothermaceae bacterium]|nr:TRAP transporter small permease [Rhodothermaceae bacterium]